MPDSVFTAYEKQIADLHGIVPGADTLRQQAFKTIRAIGLPSVRSEDWRYMDLSPVREAAFDPAKPAAHAPAIPPLVDEAAARLVFVNGRYSEDLSDLGDLWQAASIRPLVNHFMSNEARVGELMRGNDAVTLLNTALMRDGMVLSIPAGVEIEEPVLIHHIMTQSGRTAVHPRHVIELGEGSTLNVIEHFSGDDDAYWTNSVLQARVSEGAVLTHTHFVEDGPNALHTGQIHVSVDAEGAYRAMAVSLGGKAARFEAHVRLLGEEADATIDGITLAATGQVHDMITRMTHAVPNATSDQVVRAIADSRGKTAFQGKVRVDRDAQGTDANQSFKALVFDRTGEANAKPELEIFADDVKCGHGATVGQLDEKALFYLTSRGVDPVTARQMLVEAFTADALVRTAPGGLAALIRDRIEAWMAARHDRPIPKADDTPEDAPEETH